jgi:D-glycero-alpha-D-manno-heptose-7-phosphate kinase
MIANTDAQTDLHPDLVSPTHQAVIDVAKGFDALGWKVNGAGGDGGSVAVLGNGDTSVKREMMHAIEQSVPGTKSIPIYLSRFGLRVWDSPVV